MNTLNFLPAWALSGCLLSILPFTARGVDQTQNQSNNPPVVITAGPDWIPLRPALDIEPGSALDFSNLGLSDAPAGKHGWVMAGANGQFAFEDSPKVPRRFYGVNLCFSSQYLDKSQADALAERLARLGYNAVRLHHYERELTQGQPESTTLNPKKVDQFDYLLSALIHRGLYLTTDLYVSRPVPWREIGVDKEGLIPMDTFKILVPVHPGAFENWKKFARSLLEHENPYTHRRYANEPALAWLAMINEGNFGNFYKTMQTFPEWTNSWNHWLGQRYQNRQKLAAAWGPELKETENPADRTVALPEKLYGEGLRARDCIAFLSDTEHSMVIRMKKFLRDDLHCRALISNSSSWTRFTTDQASRMAYDYVDDHFYVDHPQFLQGAWRLPSHCANASPIAEGAPGGRTLAFTRLFDKPFTVTEYNYAGPGKFRGIGGILTGALGALQGWGGLWRFDYSSSREAEFAPSPMGYFDMVCDPLSQAAERASLCLFLRGDLQPAPHSVALVMTEADLANPAAKIPTLAPQWHWLAWVTRVGTQVLPSAQQPLSETAVLPLAWSTPAAAYRSQAVLPLAPYAVDNAQLLTALQARKTFKLDPALDPARKFFRSETGEITIDAPRGQLVLDTTRTAGGYASAGETIDAPKGGVRISMAGSDATVWVSALDHNPISRSHRLLVTHLTDLQNTNIRYAEAARQTLLDWGRMPYLVRAGKAEVSIRLQKPGAYQVWALGPGGKRLAKVPCQSESGTLHFVADVAGDTAAGARMLYEIAN